YINPSSYARSLFERKSKSYGVYESEFLIEALINTNH
ncbi:unnamed protein product, partial [Heterotrigona itama]